ncbi:MAG: hypothetical protein A3A80_00100 [Candidatus Terrybacteria bacterium RIFCSPLOWO2_01_FULL_44_24]|uniref:Uncharacterized protein n=1 Tax=Candidatus Terrybacteria bacterium RIFCSPHIGHO2_01_FULL_43_35 TaxID=1802361 RepID=A0A1G2PHQ1_9BACT|nr:MAG: hypothetical protein A2828_03425 [Candidatus Terrybacteria bacterium RIFCSPHIGHO2_01_FULL_43_35]OHA50456.1 MAG: hypothetical protein A3B75_00895 [Candidatus Terrybacteria bacterium RIFCSPHIGHO2_02_FULL_43_14]OHA51086.1 MAG: hypothetical protein A3A80_00100 [Candidatus Terrybacteria bacterium RIFCSPLOWO2_01_FULL_44_24]
MHNAYIVINKGKTLIPVGPGKDAVGALDRVVANSIIPPACLKEAFVACWKDSSLLSCDIAEAIVSTIRFAYNS